MAVSHDALMARRGPEIGMLCEKLGNLRLDRLGQQRTRACVGPLLRNQSRPLVSVHAGGGVFGSLGSVGSGVVEVAIGARR